MTKKGTFEKHFFVTNAHRAASNANLFGPAATKIDRRAADTMTSAQGSDWHCHDLMYSQVKSLLFAVCPRIVELTLLAYLGGIPGSTPFESVLSLNPKNSKNTPKTYGNTLLNLRPSQTFSSHVL